MKTRTAIMIDGGFFLKRYFDIKKDHSYDVSKIIKFLRLHVNLHVPSEDHLYRVFYYDCIPSEKKVHNPITKKAIDFKKTDLYKFKMDLFEQLKKERKFALRMGELEDNDGWHLKYPVLKELVSGKKEVKDLAESDVTYSINQKGVDMRLGLDIASLSLKRFVDRIVLISGDSDFVPAAKLARREGIDFILDPMWSWVKPSLFEHIDGMKSLRNNGGGNKKKSTRKNNGNKGKQSK